MQFNPKPGDTIVTAERGNYICTEVLPNGGFYSECDTYNWKDWDKNGNTQDCGNPELENAYRVVKIIPAAVPAQESTLEFQLRVLEKENQILTRLLLKEGKL